MSADLLSIDRAIKDTLAADTAVQALLGGSGATRIFSEIATPGSPEPYIVFGELDNSDTNAMGGYRAFSSAVYYVKACGKGIGFGGLRALNTALDVALIAFRTSVDVDGTTVYGLMRQSTLRFSEDENGVTWYHLGGVYTTGVS